MNSDSRPAKGRSSRSKRGSTPSRKRTQIPCVFRGEYIREVVDPQLKQAWAPKRAPYGDLRKTWKSQYCLRVNPTGYPEDCPFPEETCANRFLETALKTVDAREPGALFRRMSRYQGTEDADNRPLARERVPEGRYPRMAKVRPSWLKFPGLDAGTANLVLDKSTGPSSIAEVLRSIDPRTRKVPAEDGTEGVG